MAGTDDTGVRGILASDGRGGAHRVPTPRQLESLACLVIGLAALVLVLRSHRPAAGTVFVGALAAYTVCQQVLFPTALGRGSLPSGAARP